MALAVKRENGGYSLSISLESMRIGVLERLGGAMQARWALVEELLSEFQALLAPGVMQLKVEKGIDCPATGRLEQACPALKRKGVYLIFDEHETLVYIGGTIDQALSKRVRTQISGAPFKRARWIDIIPIDSKRSYFIPALELYLIHNAKRAEFAGKSGIALLNKVGTSEAYQEWLIDVLCEEDVDP